jgi:hypothetical protein
MNCLLAPANEALEQTLFTTAYAPVRKPGRSVVPRTLFDFPSESIRPGRFEPRVRRDEDSERWDGLS